jgi:hypothetical protein
MEIATYETVGGAYIINDEEEDAPLARLDFYAEAKALPQTTRAEIAAAVTKAVVKALRPPRPGYNFMIAYETPNGLFTPYIVQGRTILYGDDEYAAEVLASVVARKSASSRWPWRVVPIEAQ